MSDRTPHASKRRKLDYPPGDLGGDAKEITPQEAGGAKGDAPAAAASNGNGVAARNGVVMRAAAAAAAARPEAAGYSPDVRHGAELPAPRRVYLCPSMVEVHVDDHGRKHAESSDISMKNHPDAFAAGFQLEKEFLPPDCTGNGETGDTHIMRHLEEGSETFQIVERIIDTTAALTAAVGNEGRDVPDSVWAGSVLHNLFGLQEEDREELSRQLTLLLRAAAIELRAQPTVVHAHAPAKVFGDMHGQLRDLLLLFREFGGPFHRTGDVEIAQYVFNGDWVDRGEHQLETVVVLLALKARYPRSVWLVRGNHESSEMNKSMSKSGHRGFDQDVLDKFKTPTMATDIFRKVHQVFSYLPMACVIDDAILVLHGGIGDGEWNIAELAHVQRPISDMDIARSNLLTQVLWSDPDEEGDKPKALGVHDNPRGASILAFGPDITKKFCRRNGIRMVVRSHEYVPEGFRWAHGGRLVTVFSARDYDYDAETNTCEQNDGAILFVTRENTGPDPSGEANSDLLEYDFSLKVTAKVLHRRGT